MDILAHGLWAGAALKATARRKPIARRMAAWTIALSAVPDFGHALPVAIWSLVAGAPGLFVDYALATPGSEPPMPATVALWSHHLHCILHSGLIAAIVTFAATLSTGRFWLPLAGWWSHIVIDTFAHSSNFYPTPVFYPVSYWGYEGLAWNTPAFMLVNYLALAAVWALLLRR